jgi:hypothetical protein
VKFAVNAGEKEKEALTGAPHPIEAPVKAKVGPWEKGTGYGYGDEKVGPGTVIPFTFLSYMPLYSLY